MKYDNIKSIVSSKNITIPIYIYKCLHKLDIDSDSFVFLMYLACNVNNKAFDVKGISDELGIDIKNIMNYISILQDKRLLELKVSTNDNGIMEEYISLDLFYDKISMLMINEINESKTESSNVFKILESELNKELSPIEREIVISWKDNGYSDEIIKEAIKEAVYNGVSSLRYIDKILYEWDKKNIKTKEDVLKNKKNYREKEKEGKIEKIELFDYDWMEDSSNEN